MNGGPGRWRPGLPSLVAQDFARYFAVSGKVSFFFPRNFGCNSQASSQVLIFRERANFPTPSVWAQSSASSMISSSVKCCFSSS
jgi:hypothetical protein